MEGGERQEGRERDIALSKACITEIPDNLPLSLSLFLSHSYNSKW